MPHEDLRADEDADSRVAAILAELTLEEKALLTVGRDFWTTHPIERLGVPSIWLADGPTGLRKSRNGADPGLGSSLPATCFPTESALASSWDVELLREVARAVGAEAQANDVQVVLAPGVNLKRSPLGGRNFEYFSEDPLLAGEMASAFIDGLQSQGVGASLKHFVANEQEIARMYADSIVDERTLRELYLRPFEIAVAKARPWTIMAAYNRLAGTFCAENRRLLHDILKLEWGYEGVVVSDWGAVDDRVAGIEAGLHLQMPAGRSVEGVVSAVRSGRLSETRLDEIVAELLGLILKADDARRPGASFDPDDHHRLARRAAAESAVLLKNDRGLLPLDVSNIKEIALIGSFAVEPRYQGSGSSQVVPTRLETAHDELRKLVGPSMWVAYAPGYAADGRADAALIREAEAIASGSDVAIVFVGLPAAEESEGVDRHTLDLPASHNALIEAIAKVQPNVVVVLTNGSPVAMPWLPRVPAVLEGWLGGQAGAGAVCDILLGRTNPSGKLAETFPVRLADTPAFLSFPGEEGECRYDEGLYTGYRWHDAREVEPVFPFGHGLSYTRFEYSELAVDKLRLRDVDTVSVALKVKNVGDRAGRECVQLYVREVAPQVRRPQKELRGFVKVALDPGEETEARFELGERDFAYYDPSAPGWVTSGGSFDLLVGSSSRDIRLRVSVELESTRDHPMHLTRLSPIRKWLQHSIGRTLLLPLFEAQMRKMFGASGEQVPAELFDSFYDMPLSKLVTFGAVSEAELDRLLEEVNA